MKLRQLGDQGPLVSEIGMGCAGLTGVYGFSGSHAEAVATIRRAIELNVSLFDTADSYGPHSNELLLGEAVRGFNDRIILSSKVGQVLDANGSLALNGRPEHILSAIDGSLSRLGVDRIDLYYLHRVDPKVPVEESVGAMAELKRAGKIRWLGLCETSAENLIRAHKEHPINAIQSEYSLWARDPESAVLDICQRSAIALIAYAPLGRAMLTGEMMKLNDGDARRRFPRFQGENLKANLLLVEQLRAVAARYGCSPAQLSLAWLLAQAPNVIPIPGSTSQRHVEDNVSAGDIEISADDLALLRNLFGPSAVVGERYSEPMRRLWEG